jgi:hypothetical protein
MTMMGSSMADTSFPLIYGLVALAGWGRHAALRFWITPALACMRFSLPVTGLAQKRRGYRGWNPGRRIVGESATRLVRERLDDGRGLANHGVNKLAGLDRETALRAIAFWGAFDGTPGDSGVDVPEPAGVWIKVAGERRRACQPLLRHVIRKMR